MFDALSIAIRRCRPATCVEDALKQLVSPGLIDIVRDEVAPADLIETIALELSISKEVLLQEAARRLGMRASIDAQPPSEDLISKTGQAPELLERMSVVPQASQIAAARYMLLTADPTVIDICAFEAQGVQIALSLGSTVAAAWKKYRRRQQEGGSCVSDAQLVTILRQLAHDAAKLGAQTVFIGYPGDSHYEFMAGERRYRGRIHPLFYKALLRELGDVGLMEDRCESNELQSIRVSVTRSFGRPIACLTWQLSSNSVKKSENAVREVPTCTTVSTESPTSSSSSGESDRQVMPRAPILLVDDDSRFAHILARILDSKGWPVVCRDNGRAALDYLSEESSPALVICDVHMPCLDGSGFVRELKASRSDLPVLMLTSDDDQLLEAELVLLGIDAFVRKQEDPRVLLAWVDNLTRKHSTDRALETDDISEEPVMSCKVIPIHSRLA